MQKFDYSVLAVPMTYAQARKQVKTTPKFYKNVLLVFILLLLILVVQMIGAGLYLSRWFFVPIIGYVIFAGYFYIKYRKEILRTAALQAFAKANDMVFIQDYNLDSSPYVGSLFSDGHTRYITQAVRSRGEDDAIEVGNYRYITGRGRGAKTREFSYILIKLDKSVPHIFIDSKDNNRNRMFYRNHASDYSKSQKLEFEGDFNKHFTVLVPDEYGRDANYILTPDVLQALVDYGKDYDFELMGDTLLMFKHGHANMADVRTLETILSKATRFAAEFRKQTRFYVDERVALGEVDSIATGGQRLKSSFPWILALIVGYVIFNFILAMFN